MRGFFVMPSVAAMHAATLAASLEPGFPRKMVRAILNAFARVVRIHVAGDFYDAAYVVKWIDVVRSCPDVTFFAYTRSWRVPEILEPLKELAALPNMHLWFSEDRQSGDSPYVPGVRVAFLVADALDEIMVPPHADLVFREKQHELVRPGIVKRVAGILVCPVEQSSPVSATLTCSTCRICLTSSRLKQKRTA